MEAGHVGHVTLDFTEAVIAQAFLQIDAEMRSGTLTLLTKPGIDVDTDEVAVRSSGSVKVRHPGGGEVRAILRIAVSGAVASGHLRARPRRAIFPRKRPNPSPPALPRYSTVSSYTLPSGPRKCCHVGPGSPTSSMPAARSSRTAASMSETAKPTTGPVMKCSLPG